MANKQTGSLDLAAGKAAASGATNFITSIDNSNGIQVHAINNEETNYVKINSAGMEIYNEGNSIAKYGADSRIGLEESSHLSILGNSISGVASNGIEYFEVSENGGSKITTTYTTIFPAGNTVLPTRSCDLSTTSTSARGMWLSIEAETSFRIKVEYFCRTPQAAMVRYTYRTFDFVKGHNSVSTNIEYNGNNTITITGYPSPPSNATNFTGCRAYLGKNQTVALPFYRFGEDVAESGSGYSFLTGRGTKSMNATWPQLVTGKYNDSDVNALFIVGNGSSNTARDNAFLVTPFSIDMNTDVNVNGSTLDYITTRGKSGDWYYEKWASGKVEAWAGSISSGTLDSIAAQGNLYRATDISISIPSGIFPAAPTYTMVFAGYTSAVFITATGNASSATNINCQIWKATKNTTAVNLRFHCIYFPSDWANY